MTRAEKSSKLAPRFVCPYPIVKKVHHDSYEIAMSKNLKIHPVFHTSLVKLYQHDAKRIQQADKVLLADGKTEGQLVLAVIDHRRRRGKEEYKVHWLGEIRRQATWEPQESLKQIPGLIAEYWNSKKGRLLSKRGHVMESNDDTVIIRR